MKFKFNLVFYTIKVQIRPVLFQFLPLPTWLTENTTYCFFSKILRQRVFRIWNKTKFIKAHHTANSLWSSLCDKHGLSVTLHNTCEKLAFYLLQYGQNQLCAQHFCFSWQIAPTCYPVTPLCHLFLFSGQTSKADKTTFPACLIGSLARWAGPEFGPCHNLTRNIK